MNPKPNHLNKINSVNYLRGIAVLIVMVHHLLFCYNARWYVIKDILKFPDRTLQMSLLEITGWVGGSFGVAVFFLISGFVIPLTLARQSSIVFLIRRVFRIYPIAICAVLVFIITRYIYSQVLHQDFYFSIKSFLERLTFIGDLIFFRNVDLFGFWTLQLNGFST